MFRWPTHDDTDHPCWCVESVVVYGDDGDDSFGLLVLHLMREPVLLAFTP